MTRTKLVLALRSGAALPASRADAVWCDLPGLADSVRAVREVRGLPSVTAIAAVAGRSARIGALAPAGMRVAAGDRVVVSTRPGASDGGSVPVRARELARDVSRGEPLFVEGSSVTLEVDDVRGAEIRCRARTGGVLHAGRALWLPATTRSAPCFSPDDRDALAALAGAGADWIALPDVRDAAEVAALRTALRERGHEQPVIAVPGAGLEAEAVRAIAGAVDAVLIDRGAMSAGVPAERALARQQEWIAAARAAGAVVVVGGGVLAGMSDYPAPAPADLADLHRVLELEPDALVLEEDVTRGPHAEAALRAARAIVEGGSQEARSGVPGFLASSSSEFDASSIAAAARAACESGARALLVLTTTARPALLAARARPTIPLIALTPRSDVARRLGLAYGIRALEQPPVPADDRVAAASRIAIELGLASAGDPVALLAAEDASQAVSLTVFRARPAAGRARREFGAAEAARRA